MKNNVLIDYLNLVDKDFFSKYQKSILKIVNTHIGKSLFGLSDIREKIIKITPNSFVVDLGLVYDLNKKKILRKKREVFYTIPKFAIKFNAIFSWLPFYYSKTQLNGQWCLTPKFGLTTYIFNPNNDAIDIQSRKIASGDTWSNIRSYSSSTCSERMSGSREICYQTTRSSVSGRYILWARGIFQFDTSSLDDSNEIESAKISIYGTDKANSLTETDLVIVQYTNTSYTTSVDSSSGNIGNFDTTSFGSISYSNYSTSGYNDIELNSSGIANISKTGISRFGALTDRDRANSQPSWIASSSMGYYGHYSGESGKEPKLSVTYLSVDTSSFFQLF